MPEPTRPRPAKKCFSLFVLGLSFAISPPLAQPQLRRSADTFDWESVVRLPGEEAIKLANLPVYREYQMGILNLVFRMWALEDPSAAYDRMLVLPEAVDSSLLASSIIEQWLRIDPHNAMAAAANADDAQTFESALRIYAHQDPVNALAITQAYGDSVGKTAWTGVIEGISSSAPELAAEYIASLGTDGEYLIGAFITQLTLKSPATALDWLQANFPRQNKHYDTIASFFYIRNPAEALAYLQRMPDGRAKRAYGRALSRARSVNEESRALSGLD